MINPITKNLSDLSSMLKGGMETTEINFNLSPNSKNSPLESLPLVSATDMTDSLRKKRSQILIQNKLESHLSPKQQSDSREIAIFEKYLKMEIELKRIYEDKFCILEARNETLGLRNAQLVNELNQLQKVIEELKDQNGFMVKESEVNAVKEAQRNREVVDLKLLVSKLENLVRAGNEENEDKELGRNDFRQENEALRAKINQLEGQMAEWGPVVESSKLTKMQLKNQLESLSESEKIRNDLMLAIEKIRNEKLNIEKMLVEMKSKSASLESRVNELTNQFNSSVEEKNRLQDELEKLNDDKLRVTGLQLEVESYKRKVEDLEKSVADGEYAMQQKDVKIENYDLELNSAYEKIKTLKEMNFTYNQNLRSTEMSKRKVSQSVSEGQKGNLKGRLALCEPLFSSLQNLVNFFENNF